jgi:hypothetical protein
MRHQAPPPDGEAVPIEIVPFTDVEPNPVYLGSERLPSPVAGDRTATVLEPLFPGGWSRAITCALAARPAEVGALDVERLIDLVVLRQPIRRLPRRERLISATEVVVAIDTRGTLAWFRADAEHLVQRLDAATRAAVTVIETDGAPVLAATTEAPRAARRRRLLEDEEPEREQIRIGADGRVIALTDLGLGSSWTSGDPGRARAWIELAVALRARGASLAVVTPVPAERIPPQLARLAACVYWDRATRPGQVHRLIKERV